MKAKLLFLIFSVLIYSNFGITQMNGSLSEECAATYVNENIEKETFIKPPQAPLKSNRNQVNGIYQVPIVVHVIHEGESVGVGNNISDAEVKEAVKRLNYRWRKIPGTVGDHGGVDMAIEFSLAIRDENGNCTDGIVRVDLSGEPLYVNDGITYNGSAGLDYYSGSGLSLHSYVQPWNTLYYYNVYVVKTIAGAAGFAYYPSSHGQPWDGTVIRTNVLTNPNRTTFTHELGHAFNLRHTFQGDNNGASCPSADPNQGDLVYDTPAHIRSSALGINCANSDVNNCDPTFAYGNGTHQDHILNYLDYSSCRNEYTGGQRDRSHYAYTNLRSSYLSSMGLSPGTNVQADFIKSGNDCANNTVSFYDISSCIPNTYTNNGYINITFQWTFDDGNGTVLTSNLQNPTITFPTTGIFSVQLTIQTPSGSYTETKPNFVNVTNVPTACVPTSTFQDDVGHGLNRVVIESIDYQALPNTLIPYKDLACSLQTNIVEGVSHDLKVVYSSGGFGSADLEVYIDWDLSGTFEPTELITSDIIPTASNTDSVMVSFIPPAGLAVNQAYRMRVINSENGQPAVCGNNMNQACVDFSLVLKSACQESTIQNITLSSNNICPEETVQVSIQGNLNHANQWSLSSQGCHTNILESNVTGDFLVSPSQTTTYYISADAQCFQEPICDSFTVQVDGCLNLVSQSKEQISESRIYPNPNNGSFSVDLFLHNAGDVNFELHDLSGRKIYDKQKHYQAGNHTTNFSLTKIEKGAYVLSVYQKAINIGNHRIIIE